MARTKVTAFPQPNVDTLTELLSGDLSLPISGSPSSLRRWLPSLLWRIGHQWINDLEYVPSLLSHSFLLIFLVDREMEGKVPSSFLPSEPQYASRPRPGTKSHSIPFSATAQAPAAPSLASNSLSHPFPPPRAGSPSNTLSSKTKPPRRMALQPAQDSKRSVKDVEPDSKAALKGEDRAVGRESLTIKKENGAPSSSASTKTAVEGRRLTRTAAKDNGIEVEGIFPMHGVDALPDRRHRRNSLAASIVAGEHPPSPILDGAGAVQQSHVDSGSGQKNLFSTTAPLPPVSVPSKRTVKATSTGTSLLPFHPPLSRSARSSAGPSLTSSRQPATARRSPLGLSPLRTQLSPRLSSSQTSAHQQGGRGGARNGLEPETEAKEKVNSTPVVHLQPPTSPRHSLTSETTTTSASPASRHAINVQLPPAVTVSSSLSPVSSLVSSPVRSTSTPLTLSAIDASTSVRPRTPGLPPVGVDDALPKSTGKKRPSVTYGSSNKRRRVSEEYEDVMDSSFEQENVGGTGSTSTFNCGEELLSFF
jgi:hypothetical protein